MDHDPYLHDPSGRWRERGGVGGAAAAPWHQTQPGPVEAASGLEAGKRYI